MILKKNRKKESWIKKLKRNKRYIWKEKELYE